MSTTVHSPLSTPRLEFLVAQLRDALAVDPSLQVACLFGSAVRDQLRADSDIDVAVLADKPLAPEQKLSLAQHLEASLSRPVDLLDLSTLSGAILQQVLCTGRVVLRKNPDALAALMRKMIYHQADMMPYIRRTLAERQRRFLHG